MFPLLSYRTYILREDAEWVTFVHGAGGSSAIWHKQIREFSQHFNVLMVDLRGHGNSADIPVESRKYTFEDLGTDVIEVMDHLGIEKSHFVGISLGSILIRSIAEACPERVSTLVMGGAVTRLNFRSRALVGLGNLFKRVVPYIWLYGLFAWIIMPKRRHREARSLFIGEARRLCQKEFLRWFSLTWRVNPLLRLFEEKEIGVPTLYLMGEEDYMFLPAVKALIRKHTRSILAVVEGAGHVCNVDRPHLFNERAVSFIKAHSAAAPAV